MEKKLFVIPQGHLLVSVTNLTAWFYLHCVRENSKPLDNVR